MARKGRRSSKDERIDAIRLLEQGYTKAQVARICNVTESSVYGWQKAYREGGLAALSAAGRGLRHCEKLRYEFDLPLLCPPVFTVSLPCRVSAKAIRYMTYLRARAGSLRHRKIDRIGQRPVRRGCRCGLP